MGFDSGGTGPEDVAPGEEAEVATLDSGSSSSSSASSSPSLSAKASPSDEPLDLKVELTKYLQVREESNADEEAKKQVGKVVGGTRGNAVLEYVSGSPGKESVVEEAPGVFDYDELMRYGFGYLVTPIMDAGGRPYAYDLMGITPPPLPERARPKTAPKLVIDYEGEGERGKYSGLKMGQILDDDEMGRKLAEIREREKAGEVVGGTKGRTIKTGLELEEEYVMPFADGRNTGPRQVPDWTPERIDEDLRRQGAAISWAKKAKAGEFKKDPDEALTVEGSLRAYCVLGAFLTSFAYGRASGPFLTLLGLDESSAASLPENLRAAALGLAVASVGSAVLCAAVLAPSKNRSSAVWAIKGFAGGPVAVLRLRGLEGLVTRGEAEAKAKAKE